MSGFDNATGQPLSYVVADVRPGTSMFREVVRLGNGGAKRWLGPMPDSGYVDRAKKGTLLAAVADHHVLGYVLYDLPADRVKIVHLCVSERARATGIARALVNHVSSRHADRRGLELACRRDYPANGFWKHLGFRPANTRIGRSRAQHPLTIWLLDHGHPDLFTELAPERERAALDHMVFLDLVEEARRRPQGKESRELVADWLTEYIDLCITDEVFHEIDLVEDLTKRKRLLVAADGFLNISRGRLLDDDLVATAAALAPAADPPDHRHVARAVQNQATYLLSRDDKLLQASAAIERKLNLVVLRPAAFIARLDRQRSEGRYVPRALHQTNLVEAAVGEHDLEDFAQALLNYGAGERAHTLASLLRPAVAAPDRYDVRIIRDAGNRVLGGFIRHPKQDSIEVPLLRIAGSGAASVALARQLLFEQRRWMAERGGGRVVLTDPSLSQAVAPVLPRECFTADGNTWSCLVSTGLVDAREVLGELGDDAAAAAAWECERWPQKVVGAGIPTYVVPISVAYAEQLVDPGLAARTLIPRQTHLGLGREHLYYRRPRNHRGIAPGARILWYVKGAAPSHPRGAIRAISTVAEVVQGPPDRLFHRFARLGVYTQQQVRATADKRGEVMALRFVDTEPLAHPVDLPTVQEHFAAAGLQFQAPPSPCRIPEHMFCRIYRQSSAYGS